MKKYDKEKPLISIHIPKCGGTSFLAVLRGWFGKKLYTHYFDEKSCKMPRMHSLRSGLFKRKFKKGICIHGHFNRKRRFGVSDYYPEIDQFIVILRDPLEMSLSNYFFVKKQRGARYRNGTVLRMEDQYENVNDYLLNHKTYLLYHFPEEITIENYEKILNQYFLYVGILEDIQVSVNILAKKLNFPKVITDHVNISKRDEQVAEEIKEEFVRNHYLEYAIYNYALRNYRAE